MYITIIIFNGSITMAVWATSSNFTTFAINIANCGPITKKYMLLPDMSVRDWSMAQCGGISIRSSIVDVLY